MVTKEKVQADLEAGHVKVSTLSFKHYGQAQDKPSVNVQITVICYILVAMCQLARFMIKDLPDMPCFSRMTMKPAPYQA